MNRTMYGTQDASAVWQETYIALLKEFNVECGTAWPSIFYHRENDSRFLCHGDDFIIVADEDGQQFVERILARRFEYRVDGCIGPEAKDGTVMTVLNRIIEFDKSTGVIRYEGDPRHAETVIKQLGLEGAKPVTTPAEKVTGQEALAASGLPVLPPERAGLYRSVVIVPPQSRSTS